MFARPYRLRRSQDIQHVVTHGNRAQTPHLRLYWLRRGPRPGDRANLYRLTVVVGKKVDKSAVIRNRIKRRVRAALKNVGFPDGLDAVVLPRASVLNLPFTTLVADLDKLKQRLL